MLALIGIYVAVIGDDLLAFGGISISVMASEDFDVGNKYLNLISKALDFLL